MAATVGFTSCDDYLDKLPDNRMELSSPSDVSKLLVNAYSETNPAYLLEMYSDNTTEYYNNAWTAESRFQDQAYAWADITETGNESVNLIWDSYYSAIRTANEAIAFIEKQKTRTSTRHSSARHTFAALTQSLSSLPCSAAHTTRRPQTRSLDCLIPQRLTTNCS